MDALYFKTYDKELLIQELGLHTNPDIFDGKFFNGSIYETPSFMLVWIGKRPKTISDTGVVLTWEDGEYFNVWTRGQDQMDFFTDLRSSHLLTAPETPDLTLSL